MAISVSLMATRRMFPRFCRMQLPAMSHSSSNDNYYNNINPSLFVFRNFSSKPAKNGKNDTATNTEQSAHKEEEEKQPDYVLLYHRNQSRNTAHRAFFGVSVFNTVYWLWYSIDFVPAVNASPMEDLHINPSVGLGGIALGLLINSLTVLYPLSTISRLAYSPATATWRVWNHSLPFLGPSMGDPKEYPLGDLTMDPTSQDTKKILKDGIDAYSGHLGIVVKGSKFPYLMEIKDPVELIGDKDFLLQALLDPNAVSNAKNEKNERRRKGRRDKRRRKGKR